MEMKYILAIALGSLLLLSGTGVTLYHTVFKSATPITTGYEQETVGAFYSWQSTYGKKYSTTDEATYRFAVFANNLRNIMKHNNESTSYKAGVNQFSDMSREEFQQKILMNNLPKPKDTQNVYERSGRKAESSIDWRKQGAVTPIKDQGQCGSCWSFSTTGVLEGTNYLFGTKQLQSYAEQQLVDCCGKDGYQCQGCSGAWPEWAVEYVEAKSITTEDQYKYTAQEGDCKEDSVKKVFTVSSYNMITAGSEDDLIDAVNNQPVSICVDASSWFDYSSGVFDGCTSSPQLDHAVLLVGYTADYYIVKNSWNTSWGEDGYIRLPRGKNACGIANHALTTSI